MSLSYQVRTNVDQIRDCPARLVSPAGDGHRVEDTGSDIMFARAREDRTAPVVGNEKRAGHSRFLEKQKPAEREPIRPVFVPSEHVGAVAQDARNLLR